MVRLRNTLEALGLGSELVSWADAHVELGTAWERCPRGDWLVQLAARVGVERRLIVLSATDGVQMAQRYVPLGESRPARAIELAIAWSRGLASGTRCWAAGFAASAASDALPLRGQHVAYAAACLAFACDETADETYYTQRAHAAEALTFAARSYEGTPTNAHQVCAELVRAHIAFDEVASRLDAALRGSVPPPPPDLPSSEEGAFAAERSPWFRH